MHPSLSFRSLIASSAARRWGMVVGVAAGFLYGEAPLIAIILGLKRVLGFMVGMGTFCLLVCATNAIVLMGLQRLANRASSNQQSRFSGWVRRRSTRFRNAGSIQVAILGGPILTAPILRSLGYTGKDLALRSTIGAIAFGVVWYNIYGGGMSVLWTLGKKLL